VQADQPNIDSSVWANARFRVRGTTLQAKVWGFEVNGSEEEPSAWDMEVQDSDISGAGWVGLGRSHSTSTRDWDFFAVGTGTDDAPVSLLAYGPGQPVRTTEASLQVLVDGRVWSAPRVSEVMLQVLAREGDGLLLNLDLQEYLQLQDAGALLEPDGYDLELSLQDGLDPYDVVAKHRDMYLAEQLSVHEDSGLSGEGHIQDVVHFQDVLYRTDFLHVADSATFSDHLSFDGGLVIVDHLLPQDVLWTHRPNFDLSIVDHLRVLDDARVGPGRTPRRLGVSKLSETSVRLKWEV
jgi:hypothetical protein